MSAKRHRKNFNGAGHAHELTFSCYKGYPLLSRDRTRRWLIMAIEQARARFGISLLAYVIMPEHVHLIVWPGARAYDMAQIRSAIKQPVSRRAMLYLESHAPHWLERLTRQRGRRTERLFWQSGGGYDRNVTEPQTLKAMTEYIHANPVRRGLVARPTDWHWSSARWYAGMRDGPIVLDAWPT